MIFFTADTHFNDPRVLRLDRRPFANLAEHDAALIASWNEVVGPGDTVFHLGDSTLASATAFLYAASVMILLRRIAWPS